MAATAVMPSRPATACRSAARRAAGLTPALLFVNTAGSFLVLLRLSAAVSAQTHSGFLPAVVLSAPWLLALVLAKPLHRVLRDRAPERLMRLAETVSLLGTAALVVLPLTGNSLLSAAVCLLLARGFFEAVTRSAASVLLRVTIRAERLYRVNTIAEIGKLAGTGAGATLAGPLSTVLSLRAFLLLNAATLAVSALLAWTLPRTPPLAANDPASGAAAGMKDFLRCLKDATLRRLFVVFLLVAFWQGFHTIAVNTVPRDVLHGGTSLVGAFVALSAMGIFAGSMAAMVLERYLTRLPRQLWAALPMVPLLTAVFAGRTVPTFAAYTVFMIMFEMVYVCSNNMIIARADPGEVAAVVAMRATLLPLVVVVSVLACGLLTTLIDPRILALIVAAISCAVAAGVAGSARRDSAPVG